MIDPNTLDNNAVETPPPFEGEQILEFVDYDLRQKDNGFWLLLDFRGPEQQRASWSGNFFTAPDTDGRKKAQEISFASLRAFFRAAGYSENDFPAASPRALAMALNKLVSADGNNVKVKATVGQDERGYMNASRFKAA